LEPKGKYHKFSGYGQSHPSPQRTPVLFQAGSSSAGIAFAGKHAETLYCGGAHIPPLLAYTKKICASALAQGRDPSNIKAFAAVTPVIGRTVEEAWEKFRIAEAAVSWEGGLAAFCGYSGVDLSKFPLDEPIEFDDNAMSNAPLQNFLKTFKTIDPDKKWTPRQIGHSFAFGTNVPKPVGTPEMIADFLEEWLDGADVDGFNLSCRSPASHQYLHSKLKIN
jgi:alkanesulfonate monooxygenase SsuD/methylene tetrahydromethanopterin reductase-like flavin-dependent oxidoreductase (luciferase family)